MGLGTQCKDHWTSLALRHPFQQGIFTFSFCAVCVWYLNNGNLLPSWTRELSCRKNWRELSPLSESRSRPQFPPGQVMLSGKPLDPPSIHGVQEETCCFIDAPLWLTYIVSFGPECLLMMGGWGGEGGWTVKSVCMSIVFCRASDGVELYLYYVFYVRVKLNSWHQNIEALFKPTGCLFKFFFYFLLLILTDVLLWVSC